MARRRPRVAYLVSHPIQYQAPLFRRLAASSEVDFVALFGCDFGLGPSFDPQFGRAVDFGVDLLGDYRSVFLPQVGARAAIDRFWGLRTPSIYTALKAAPVDVLVLHGWRTAMMWQAALGSRIRGIPYLMRAETPAFEKASAVRSLRRAARDSAVGLLIRGSAGALALGSANRRFYLQMGLSSDRIHRMPYFVDDVAVTAAAGAGSRDRASVRRELGISEDAWVVVSVAKLIPRKRPLDLVQALRSLPERVHLLWVGSGELEEKVRAAAASAGVSGRVHLVGFRPPAEVWRILGASDVFALASEAEPWGLVVNEAVTAGIPALVSDECGAAEDLVVPGRTGEILPVGDVSGWASALRVWFERSQGGDRGDVLAMRARAEAHSLDGAASALEEAVLSVFGRN